jgi:hypothetical protein
MPEVANPEPGTEYVLSTSANSVFRVLGPDEDGHVLMAVRKRNGPINAAIDFPAGATLFLVQKKNAAVSEWVEVRAFEYGRYASAEEFALRRVQNERPRAVSRGILTCARVGDI